jgi:PTH1 family peptidyl-tRNA hydrolase
MKLIIGLGNPGAKYQHNRHNIGFLALDYLIQQFNARKINSSFKGELYKCADFLLLKPVTYMNLSGESAVLVKNYYKIENENIIVIHDDIDLKTGALKFKRGGSHGGHNGLKSLDRHIGNDYWRVRIGVGRPERKEMVVNYVLSDFTDEEMECMKSLFPKIEKAVYEIEKAASKYSQKEC